MATGKLLELLAIIKKEERLARKRLSLAKIAANETSKTAVASWSAAGDRHYSEGQAAIIGDYYAKIKVLRQEVGEAVKLKKRTKITPPAFVRIFLSGEEKEFYFVYTPVHLPGVRMVSSDSSLGKAVLGKEAGEGFSFTSEKVVLKGRVIHFE